MSMDQDAGLTEVLAANEHFYDVFRSGDMAAMYELWSSRESISVYHPNWPGISGRDDVMTSWHQVMVMGEPPAVFARTPTVIRQGKTAVVFCTEVIEGNEMTASNVFVLENGAWKLTCHHARPLPVGDEADDSSDEPGGAEDGDGWV